MRTKECYKKKLFHETYTYWAVINWTLTKAIKFIESPIDWDITHKVKYIIIFSGNLRVHLENRLTSKRVVNFAKTKYQV